MKRLLHVVDRRSRFSVDRNRVDQSTATDANDLDATVPEPPTASSPKEPLVSQVVDFSDEVLRTIKKCFVVS